MFLGTYVEGFYFFCVPEDNSKIAFIVTYLHFHVTFEVCLEITMIALSFEIVGKLMI